DTLPLHDALPIFGEDRSRIALDSADLAHGNLLEATHFDDETHQTVNPAELPRSRDLTDPGHNVCDRSGEHGAIHARPPGRGPRAPDQRRRRSAGTLLRSHSRPGLHARQPPNGPARDAPLQTPPPERRDPPG